MINPPDGSSIVPEECAEDGPGTRLADRLRAFPLFSAKGYREANPDTEHWESLSHILEHGLREHRPLLRPERHAARLSELSAETPAPDPVGGRPDALRDRGVRIILSERPTDKDLVAADRMMTELGRIGFAVGLAGADEPFGGAAPVFISPSGPISGPPPSVVLLTCPVVDLLWTDQLAPALQADAVVALEPLTAHLFARAGVPTFLWAPRPVVDLDLARTDPLFAGLSRDVRNAIQAPRSWGERPIDVVYFADESPRRDEILARHADVWAERPCVLDIQRALWRHPSPGPERAALKAFIGERAKVVLNLAAEEMTSLDWEQAGMHGAGLGALIVTTPCLADPELRAGRDFVEDSADRLGKLVRYLLSSEGSAAGERIARSATEAWTRRREAGSAAALAQIIGVGGADPCSP